MCLQLSESECQITSKWRASYMPAREPPPTSTEPDVAHHEAVISAQFVPMRADRWVWQDRCMLTMLFQCAGPSGDLRTDVASVELVVGDGLMAPERLQRRDFRCNAAISEVDAWLGPWVLLCAAA